MILYTHICISLGRQGTLYQICIHASVVMRVVRLTKYTTHTHTQTYVRTHAHARYIALNTFSDVYTPRSAAARARGAEIGRPFGPEHSAQSDAQPLPR